MYISYCNEVVDFLDSQLKQATKMEKLAKKGRLVDPYELDCSRKWPPQIQKLKNTAIKSVKFKVQDLNVLLPFEDSNLDALKKYVNVIHLPFPQICIEINPQTVHSTQTSPMVFLAVENEDSIQVNAFFKDSQENWQAFNIDGVYAYLHIDKNTFKPRLVGHEHLSRSESEENDVFVSHLIAVYEFSISSLVNLLSALSCTNTRIEDSPIKPSKKNNTLRRSKNQLPFFEFKILTIDSGKSSSVQDSSSGGGKHASPRMHLRRGHIRKLKDKNVWVNACVVGDANQGQIKKDYIVK